MSETPDIAPIPKPSAAPNFYKILACPKCGWGAHHETPEGELSTLSYFEERDLLNATCARCGARYQAEPLEPAGEPLDLRIGGAAGESPAEGPTPVVLPDVPTAPARGRRRKS